MHPSRYRINTGTVPIPDLGDNNLGDNYLNCIYNYRYQFLSKLLFLHPFMQWFSPFCHFVYCLLPTCNVQNCLTLLQFPRGESPAPRTIQRPANHNKSILHSNFWGVQNWLFWPVRHSLHALHSNACPMRQSTMLESFLQYYLSIISCEIWIDWHFLLYKGQKAIV